MEDLGPLSKGQIRGNQDRALLVALTDESKQHLCPLLRERDKAQFIDDNELLLAQGVLEPRELLLFLRFEQLVDEAGGFASARESAEQLVQEALFALSVFEGSGDHDSLAMLKAIARYVLERNR